MRMNFAEIGPFVFWNKFIVSSTYTCTLNVQDVEAYLDIKSYSYITSLIE